MALDFTDVARNFEPLLTGAWMTLVVSFAAIGTRGNWWADPLLCRDVS